ncbi:hypothetical protein Leryth_009592 [Lithospermum erythrorhizon]|nr:hypothetical protein Leryth_009592 [Lithospermum erythrorhizon]
MVWGASFDPSDYSRKYLFPPNAEGPGGITPLHVVASMANSDELVDALSNDPKEMGMRCWKSTLDSTGLSPYAYALMRNNHTYNELVAQKLADKENGQISLSIHNEVVPLDVEKEQNNKKLSEFKQRSPRHWLSCPLQVGETGVRHKLIQKIKRSSVSMNRQSAGICFDELTSFLDM